MKPTVGHKPQLGAV